MEYVSKFKKISDIALIGIFLCAITVPIIGPLLGIGNNQTLSENRQLASFPALRLERQALATYPNALEMYLKDHFGFRESLIRWNNLIQIRWLGIFDASRVVIGKEGWLFYAGEGMLDSYRATRPLTDVELTRWREVLDTRQQWLEQRHIRYLFVIVPEKSTLYPEHMPDYLNRVGNQTRLDQFTVYMHKHSHVPLLNLQKPLLEAKQHEQIFYKTDTHWTPQGALVGAQTILQQVADWYPRVHVPHLTDYVFNHHTGPGLDLARMLALEDYYPEEITTLVSKGPDITRPTTVSETIRRNWAFPVNPPMAYETSAGGLPRVVMFQDSYVTALLPFISPQFRKILYLWTHDFMENAVMEEHPDIVITEMAERYLMNPPPEY
jgi:alginate O-acetyltransferase complex protein AlgJ